MLWYHLTLTTKGRCTALADEGTRRAAVRAVARVMGEKGLLFSLVDEHAHLVVRCSAAEAGYIGRSARIVLQTLTGARWLATHVVAVEDRDHLEYLVGYCFWQPAKHELSELPLLWSGSCVQDLLGARRIAGFDPHASFRELPRFYLERKFKAAGIRDAIRPSPVDDAGVRAAGAVLLVRAGAAAVAYGDLRGVTDAQFAARRAVVQLAEKAGIPRSEIAFALGCSALTVRRLAAGAQDEPLQRAVRIQLSLPQVAERVPLGKKVPTTAWIPPRDEVPAIRTR